jgi:hypothetical protein
MVQAKVNTASEPTVLSFRHYMAGMDADISEVDAALRGAPYIEIILKRPPTHHGSLILKRRPGPDIEMMQAHSTHVRRVQHEQQEAGQGTMAS